MRFGQRDGFRQEAPRTPRRPQHRHRPGIFFDENLRTRPYARQHRGKVARCFLFRDVDYEVSHAAIITESGHIYPGHHNPQFVIRHFGEVMQFQWKAIGAVK